MCWVSPVSSIEILCFENIGSGLPGFNFFQCTHAHTRTHTHTQKKKEREKNKKNREKGGGEKRKREGDGFRGVEECGY